MLCTNILNRSYLLQYNINIMYKSSDAVTEASHHGDGNICACLVSVCSIYTETEVVYYKYYNILLFYAYQMI